MSELTYNLQQIYNCKLQIKSAIGTQSDNLEDYAGYITAMKPTGYTYITENGDHNVFGYEYVNVEVEQGITPTGTYNISENGTFDVSTYENAYVNVPTGGGDSKDIMNCYTYGIMDPFLDINNSSIRYNGASTATYCMISSYAFGQKYPAYINAEYVPNMISGNKNAGRSTYVISYMSDEMIDRGLSYNSLPDISEWNGAGFYKGKFNFNFTEKDNRFLGMFKTQMQMGTLHQNGALYDSENIGDVTRTDFIYKDNLNNTYLYINAYQSGNTGYFYSTEPMTLGSYIFENYNSAYGFTGMLHNSYNCIVYTDDTNISNNFRNSQIIDIVSWDGEAILPQPVSNVCLKSYSDNSYTQWTDSGNAYTYSLSLNQFQSMNFRAMNGSSYLTCQFGNDEATYYFGLNNLNVSVTNYGSYGYWPNADNNNRTAQWSLHNQIPATANYTLTVDKNTGKMTITAEEPKNGWYVYFNNGTEREMECISESSGEYKFVKDLPELDNLYFIFVNYVNSVPTYYDNQQSGTEVSISSYSEDNPCQLEVGDMVYFSWGESLTITLMESSLQVWGGTDSE